MILMPRNTTDSLLGYVRNERINGTIALMMMMMTRDYEPDNPIIAIVAAVV